MSCSVHDMIELERKGVPTVLLCTTGFVDPASRQATISGLPDLRIVGIPFPFASLPPERARARGVEAFDDIVSALTAADAL